MQAIPPCSHLTWLPADYPPQAHNKLGCMLQDTCKPLSCVHVPYHTAPWGGGQIWYCHGNWWWDSSSLPSHFCSVCWWLPRTGLGDRHQDWWMSYLSCTMKWTWQHNRLRLSWHGWYPPSSHIIFRSRSSCLCSSMQRCWDQAYTPSIFAGPTLHPYI